MTTTAVTLITRSGDEVGSSNLLKGFLVSLVVLFLCSRAFGADLIMSTNEDFQISGSPVPDHSLFQSVGGVLTATAVIPAGLLPPETNIDALEQVSPTNVLFSLSEDAVIGGVLYANEDILFYNGAAVSLWWDGSAAGLPPETNLDALEVISQSPQVFLFSLEEDAVLPGAGLVRDEDIIQYQGGVFTLFSSGAAMGIPPESDVDAHFTHPTSGNPIISLRSSAVIGGTLYEHSDLAQYAAGAFTVWFSGTGAGLASEVNISAADLPPAGVPVALSIFSIE